MKTVFLHPPRYLRLFLSFVLFTVCQSMYAKPVFVINSATKSVRLSPKGNVQINFTVRNNTSKTMTITNVRVTFSNQTLLKGIINHNQCSLNKGKLDANASCTISTTIYALGLTGSSDFEVQVCAFNGSLCSGMKNQIKVTTSTDGGDNPTPTTKANISLSPASLLLMTTPSGNITGLTGGLGSITVTNHSSTLTATNVSANLPSSFTTISQDASNCRSIAPLQSCTLNFTAASTEYDLTNITISGSNTNTVSASLGARFPISTDGVVHAIAHDPSTNILYIGGLFHHVGAPNRAIGMVDRQGQEKRFVRVAPRTGSSLTYVFAIVPDGNGGFYIGGSFGFVNGVARENVAHILSDYSLDTNFTAPAANNDIRAMALHNGILYLGGIFTDLGGTTRQRLAAVDAATGNLDPWDPDAGGSVFDLEIYNNNVYAVGQFTTINRNAFHANNQLTRNRAAVIELANGANIGNADTNWDPDLAGNAFAIKEHNNYIYIAGDFQNVNRAVYHTNNQLARARIAAFEPVGIGNGRGDADNIWDPDLANAGPNGGRALAIDATHVYVSGGFTTAGGNAHVAVAAISDFAGGGSGTVDNTWNPQIAAGRFNDVVRSLFLTNNSLFFGGDFTTVQGQTRLRLAEVELAGNGRTGAPTTFKGDVGTDWGMVAEIYADSTRVITAGDFYLFPAVNRVRLAAIDLNTFTVTSWDPRVNFRPRSLVVHNNQVYAGGEFSIVNEGQPTQATRNRLASFDKVSGQVTSWNPNMDGHVFALALDGDTLYAGGQFSTVTGGARNRLAAYDLTNLSVGEGLIGWNPLSNASQVDGLLVHNGHLYVGGNFTEVQPGPPGNRVHIAAYSLPTRTLDAWNPNVNVGIRVESIAAGNGKIFFVGNFTQVDGGTGRANAAAFNEAGFGAAVLDSWNPNLNGIAEHITYHNNKLYMGGAFTVINGGTPRTRFAVVDDNTGLALDPDLQLAAIGIVDAIFANDSLGQIYLGGALYRSNGWPVFGFTVLNLTN